MNATPVTGLAQNLRYEWKFIPRGLGLAEVLLLVRRHPALFRESYPPRTVNNIYLDSAGRRDFFDHITGCAHRTKTRIRWYGPFGGRQQNLQLERKIKCGQVSGKSAWPMPELNINGAVTNHTLEPEFDQAGMPEWIRASLRHAEPSLLNRYRRHYFQSASGRFRITVDSSLEFSEPRHTGAWRPLAPCPNQPVILELKFGTNHAEEAATVTNAFPFRLTRCSKYILGIRTLTVLSAGRHRG